MGRNEDASSGEVLDDKKEKSKKKKSKVAQFISSKFSKLFRERSNEDEAEEKLAAKHKRLTLRGKLLEMIGITGQSSETADKTEIRQTEETHEKHTSSGAIQRIRLIFSKLNIFDRISETNIHKESIENNEHALDLSLSTQETESDHDYDLGTAEEMVAPKIAVGGASERVEKEPSFFDKPEREERKQSREIKKTEKKIKSIEKEIDNQARESQELESELDRTQREVKKLRDNVVEQKYAVDKKIIEKSMPVQTESASVVEKSTPAQPAKQPPQKEAVQLTGAEKKAVTKSRPESKTEIEETERPKTVAHAQLPNQRSAIETAADFAKQEHSLHSTIESKDKSRSMKSEKESLIERIINPERQELTELHATSNAKSKTVVVSGTVAPNIARPVDSAKAGMHHNELNDKKIPKMADHAYELIAIVIIVLIAIVAFSILAFIALS